MEVVLPTPFTPMNSTTAGVFTMSTDRSPVVRYSARMSRIHCRAPSMSLIFSALQRLFSSSTASRVVSAPKSAITRDSSSSS